MAIVVEENRSRNYINPINEHEELALTVRPSRKPEQQARGTFASNAQGRIYGFKTFGDYFTSRQLKALTSYSDLVGEARKRILGDVHQSHLPADNRPLSTGGQGTVAYADAVATYLTMGVSRLTDICNSLCRWESSKTQVRNLFGRQSIPMVWDFAEPNMFASAAGDFSVSLGNLAKVVDRFVPSQHGQCLQVNAPRNNFEPVPAVISTDPPYYDNVAYADLSDFFYIWLRLGLRTVWPDIFRRLLTPKETELVAEKYRHGGQEAADKFFLNGMSSALEAMYDAAAETSPVTIYYAFKQSEVALGGITSPGWATFLQAIVNAGYALKGT